MNESMNEWPVLRSFPNWGPRNEKTQTRPHLTFLLQSSFAMPRFSPIKRESLQKKGGREARGRTQVATTEASRSFLSRLSPAKTRGREAVVGARSWPGCPFPTRHVRLRQLFASCCSEARVGWERWDLYSPHPGPGFPFASRFSSLAFCSGLGSGCPKASGLEARPLPPAPSAASLQTHPGSACPFSPG